MLKQFNEATNVKKKIITSMIKVSITSLIYTILIYFCLTIFNEDIVTILNGVAENNGALEVSYIIFPIFLIVFGMIELGNIALHQHNNPKYKTNSKKKK